MKKTVNKWLLLFASIFLMMAVACSNSSGGSSSEDSGNDTPQETPAPGNPHSTPGTPGTTTIPVGQAPDAITDDSYVGIKIKIKDIPTGTYARRIYVNDKVVSEVFSYGDNGNLTINQYANQTEWGYPFVESNKNYKIVVEFIGSNYQTLQKSIPLTITAKKGLGELKCPNAEWIVEDNILKFKKGAPVIYYGTNTNIKEYSNKKSGPSYAIQVFSDGWADNQYFFFGGEDLSQNTFDFARNLKKELVTDNKLLLRVWAGIEDKAYGSYVYRIAYDESFYLDLDKFPKDIFDITQYIPSNDDLKGKVLQEISKSQYIEFASAEDSKGYLPATMYACSVKPSGSSSGGTTTSYEWHETNFFYKDGKLDFGETSLTLIGDGPGLYCALAPATRVSGEGIYGTFNVWGNSISLSEDGTYSTSGTKGYYEFEDGIISFKDGILQGNIAIYDGKTFYFGMFFYTAIDKLPDPLPDPVESSDPTSPASGTATNVDETGVPCVNVSSAIPETKDLMKKVLHYSDYVKVSNEDSSSYETKTCDIYLAFGTDNSTGTLSVSMTTYITGHTEIYEEKTYSYKDGILTPSTSSPYVDRIFHVMNKFFLNPYGVELNRISGSGKGLNSSFSTKDLTITLTDKGEYTYSSGGKSINGAYTTTNGIITLKNEINGDGQMLYDGQKLYMVKELNEASSLPNKS